MSHDDSMQRPDEQTRHDDIARVWAATDYAPTGARLAPVAEVVAARASQLAPDEGVLVDVGAGHGQLAAALARSAGPRRVLAIEPTARLVGEGAALSLATVTWRQATAERTGLDDGEAAALASCFGWMFGEPSAAGAEAARVLRPDGALVFTAWAERGFLHDMTQRMTQVLPFLAGASHLAWGRAETARERLAPYFGDVEIEVCDLDWSFPSVAAGMELYRHGSPPHTASFAAAGERRGELEAVLEDHLRSEAGPDGAIRSQASYLLITATQPRG